MNLAELWVKYLARATKCGLDLKRCGLEYITCCFMQCQFAFPTPGCLHNLHNSAWILEILPLQHKWDMQNTFVFNGRRGIRAYLQKFKRLLML